MDNVYIMGVLTKQLKVKIILINDVYSLSGKNTASFKKINVSGLHSKLLSLLKCVLYIF